MEIFINEHESLNTDDNSASYYHALESRNIIPTISYNGDGLQDRKVSVEKDGEYRVKNTCTCDAWDPLIANNLEVSIPLAQNKNGDLYIIIYTG